MCKCGGYKKKSGRSYHGYYKGIWCDSTYELAYLIYCLDHNIDIKRCNETFKYEYENKIHEYHPDFEVNGILIEIKGYYTELVDIKASSIIEKPYKILYYDDLQEVFEYVAITYNKKNYVRKNNFYELYDDYKPRYEYVCLNCGKSFTRERKVKTELKFCSRTCSGKYIHSLGQTNEDIKNKISNSLKEYYKLHKNEQKNNRFRKEGNTIDSDRIKYIEEHKNDEGFFDKGWSSRLAKEFGISSGAIGKWFNKNMPELYKKIYNPKRDLSKRYNEIDNYLKENYGKKTRKEILQELDIKEKTYYNRLRKLGLIK